MCGMQYVLRFSIGIPMYFCIIVSQNGTYVVFCCITGFGNYVLTLLHQGERGTVYLLECGGGGRE